MSFVVDDKTYQVEPGKSGYLTLYRANIVYKIVQVINPLLWCMKTTMVEFLNPDNFMYYRFI